jgi:DNA ligase-associated metallophosphoesterase
VNAVPELSIRLGRASLVPDLSGALFWPEQSTLVVADLHFEKASHFAQRSAQFLPPYDTATTITALESVLRRLAPERVIALGDSVHDPRAVQRIDPVQIARIAALTAAHEWIWVAGNHDPSPPVEWGGRMEQELSLDGIVFRHEAEPGALHEVSGHCHPKARVLARGAVVSGRCFAADATRIVLPAFGAFTGGLNVLDPAIAALFQPDFAAIVLGQRRLYRFDARALLP